ncbi:MAG: hypothetical protein L0216_06050 [Planctomycetales bacterium]|nr:hypothetical protein [Planctomycetales bacterium]
MRVAGVREFRNRVPEIVRSDEIVFVTRHGKLSGILVPLGSPRDLPVDLRREILDRLGSAIAAHLRKRGVGEGVLQRDFEAWRKSRHARRRGR